MHIEVKTRFKIIYFITPKESYAWSNKLIFKVCRQLLTHIICPFCAYAAFINETPGLLGTAFLNRINAKLKVKNMSSK